STIGRGMKKLRTRRAGCRQEARISLMGATMLPREPAIAVSSFRDSEPRIPNHESRIPNPDCPGRRLLGPEGKQHVARTQAEGAVTRTHVHHAAGDGRRWTVHRSTSRTYAVDGREFAV